MERCSHLYRRSWDDVTRCLWLKDPVETASSVRVVGIRAIARTQRPRDPEDPGRDENPDKLLITTIPRRCYQGQSPLARNNGHVEYQFGMEQSSAEEKCPSSQSLGCSSLAYCNAEKNNQGQLCTIPYLHARSSPRAVHVFNVPCTCRVFA